MGRGIAALFKTLFAFLIIRIQDTRERGSFLQCYKTIISPIDGLGETKNTAAASPLAPVILNEDFE